MCKWAYWHLPTYKNPGTIREATNWKVGRYSTHLERADAATPYNTAVQGHTAWQSTFCNCDSPPTFIHY